MSETEGMLKMFLTRPEIKKRREKTRGKKEKITVSLTDSTGDGVPEALLTEGNLLPAAGHPEGGSHCGRALSKDKIKGWRRLGNVGDSNRLGWGGGLGPGNEAKG